MTFDVLIKKTCFDLYEQEFVSISNTALPPSQRQQQQKSVAKCRLVEFINKRALRLSGVQSYGMHTVS